MRTTLLLISGVSILLCGCGRASGKLAQFAENTRTVTEQMAFDSERSNAEREKQNDPNIGDERNPPRLKFSERYETREGPDGLFVYDTETHSIARIGNQAQQGLNMGQAANALDALNTADAKGAGQ